MPRYIDADAEIEKMKSAVIERMRAGTDDEFANGIFNLFINALNEAPTADVQEVRRGKWILGDYACQCSRCEAWFDEPMSNNNYCPRCGASMDDGTNKKFECLKKNVCDSAIKI